MKEKYLAMLNSVYTDGSVAEIIAASLVENLEEGELWFGAEKPDDGTQVDYTLHKLTDVLARAPLV